MTLVFPVGTGRTFDRLPADQTLKHRAHGFEAITLIPYPMCPRQVLFMERQSGFAMLFESLLINVFVRDGLLFGFPRIGNQDGVGDCSSS